MEKLSNNFFEDNIILWEKNGGKKFVGGVDIDITIFLWKNYQ